MTSSLTFKLKRPFVEAVAKQFFHLWRLQMDGKEREIESWKLDDGKMHWITYLALLAELDKYFTDRIKSAAKDMISIKLSTPQAVCLYRAVMHLPLGPNEVYLWVVREALITNLYPFMISLPAVARQQPEKAAKPSYMLAGGDDVA